MTSLYVRVVVVFLKIYVAVVLVVATVLSPLALSFVPVLVLVWYLYQWLWPISAVINLLTEYFVFFAVALLLSPTVGPLFSLLIALPVLVLVNQALEDAAGLFSYQQTRYRRRPTSLYIALLIIAIVVLGVSLLLGSFSLLLAAVVIIGYFGILGIVVLRWLPLKPVEENRVYQRMVAGSMAHLNIEMSSKTKVGGLLFLESPYEWLKLRPGILPLEGNKLVTEVTLSPDLSGPSVIKLKGQAVDRWGLIQTNFELEPIDLYVIPRARYAAWLAKKYLANTKLGTLPLISNMEALRPIYGLRRGIEYYGSQLYQPGDSLKNIDWKHSLKQNELITKEFVEFQGQPAVVLINLAVGNAEEADKLAYNIIITAISLARENIPAALAAYDHEGVKLTTQTLRTGQLVLQSLKLAQEMVTFVNPVKYLNPPDVARLRANMNRTSSTESKAVKVLTELLQLEYRNLSNTARVNPATKALNEVLAKVDKQSSIVIISHRNHDAEALAFNTFSYQRKGNSVISV